MIQAPAPTQEQLIHLHPETFLPANIGEIVFYTLKERSGDIVHRPALVLLPYTEKVSGIPAEKGLTQLLIFTCPYEDANSIPKGYKNRTPQGLFVAIATHGQPNEPSTWHHTYEEG